MEENLVPLCPKVFIFYAWSDEHARRWVRDLSSRLRFNGVEIVFDDWYLRPGDQLPAFMETAVRESDFVLLVCTPSYKLKSDQRRGGVGYESNIMTGELFTVGNERKFIPLLREGNWVDASPSWLTPKSYLDFRGNPYSEESYERLVATLLDVLPSAPAVRDSSLAASAKSLGPDALTRQQIYGDPSPQL